MLRTTLLALVTAVLLTAAACATSPETSLMTDDTDSVRATLDDFHLAASEADGARYFAHFAPNGIFVGTDASERWTVDEFRAYAEPHFSQGKGWSYTATERHVSLHPDGGTAWFDERLMNDAYGETRGSGVLRRIDGTWRIEQYVLSFPIPNDVARDVVDIVRSHGAEGR